MPGVMAWSGDRTLTPAWTDQAPWARSCAREKSGRHRWPRSAPRRTTAARSPGSPHPRGTGSSDHRRSDGPPCVRANRFPPGLGTRNTPGRSSCYLLLLLNGALMLAIHPEAAHRAKGLGRPLLFGVKRAPPIAKAFGVGGRVLPCLFKSRFVVALLLFDPHW